MAKCKFKACSPGSRSPAEIGDTLSMHGLLYGMGGGAQQADGSSPHCTHPSSSSAGAATLEGRQQMLCSGGSVLPHGESGCLIPA